MADSLFSVISRTKEENTKAGLFLRISDIYIDIDLNKALVFADSGAALAKKNNWKQEIAKSQVAYGNIYNFKGDYNNAIKHITEGYNFYKEVGDKKETGKAIYALGMSYERLSDYSQAANCYFESLHIFENIPDNDHLIGNSLSAIAVIYFLQKNFSKSLEYSFKALQKQESAKNTEGIANELGSMADTYYELHDSANAMKYNLRALEIHKQTGDKTGIGIVNYQMAKVNSLNYDLALGFLFTAKKNLDELSDSSNNSALTTRGIGKELMELVKSNQALTSIKSVPDLPKDKSGLLQMAESYLQAAVNICIKTGDRENESVFSADLAEVKALKGDYKNAYLNFKVFHQIQDSIFSQDNKNKIAALESKQEIDKKQLQLENQKRKMQLLIIGISSLAILGGLLFYQNRSRKKTNTTLLQLNTELDEANKMKARFFAILSHDLRSPVANLINFLHLQKKKPDLLSEQQVQDRELKIATSAESLLETMETMLLWSKGQMENFKLQIRTVPVSSFFEYIERFFSSSEGIKFTFSNPQDLTVPTDENYLQTIMHNLTSNAVKALRNTNNATIEWKAFQQEGRTILAISDNGPGLTQEFVYTLYNQSIVANAKIGLGLHLIRDLAKAIQCTITVQTTPGAGTIFSLFA